MLAGLRKLAKAVWDLLSFSAPQGLGGRFLHLPRFATGVVFLLLRLFCALLLALLQGGVDTWWLRSVPLLYGALQLAVFLFRLRGPADKPYAHLIGIQTVLDVTFITWLAFANRSMAGVAMSLYLIPVSEASLLGAFRAWAMIVGLVVVSGVTVAIGTLGFAAAVPLSIVISLTGILRAYGNALLPHPFVKAAGKSFIEVAIADEACGEPCGRSREETVHHFLSESFRGFCKGLPLR